ncbi:MAG: ABC transporter ATP-binding protein [Ruminococcus sp.]|nr:ABC transporter ATP-binding protein [Ruminococcus sp.]
MENDVLFKVENLCKSYGKRQILKDISFKTYAGEVFGFLGPNGAGKTTTIKIAVGLIEGDSGRTEIGGFDVKRDFEKAIALVGSIVENPETYKYLTGRQNLEQYARMRGEVTKERIDEVTKIVKLEERINDKISRYSLGMRQRLGVAQAILHHPKVLILDEPTNGLDPEGIRDLRDILKSLAHDEGCSVIVSSHLMSEMELMCDRVGIISKGEMVGEYTLEELTKRSMGDSVTVRIKLSDPEAAQALYTNSYIVDRQLQLEVPSENADESTAAVVKRLVERGISVYAVAQTEQKSLEDAFIALTNTEKGGELE